MPRRPYNMSAGVNDRRRDSDFKCNQLLLSEPRTLYEPIIAAHAKQVSRVCIIMHDELRATLSLCSGAVTDVLGLSVINNAEKAKCVVVKERVCVLCDWEEWVGCFRF